jgi:hypothetical protein
VLDGILVGHDEMQILYQWCSRYDINVDVCKRFEKRRSGDDGLPGPLNKM